MARSVCCRGSAARDPPVSSANRWSRRASSSAAGIPRSRAAASSMASGMPSSRRQIRPATPAASSSSASGTPCAAARSSSSRTASLARIAPVSSPWAGTPSDGTRYTHSPSMPSGSRLVASNARFGQPRSSASASLAHAPMTCSQLSSSTSRRRPPTASTSVSSTGRPGSRRTPSTSATVTATRSGPPSGARSANHTPSPDPSTSPAATCSANRVLPAPPAPVSVTSRERSTSRRTAASSASRPMKLDTCAGKLVRSPGLSSDRSGGNRDGRPSACSWKTCSGRPPSRSGLPRSYLLVLGEAGVSCAAIRYAARVGSVTSDLGLPGVQTWGR